MSCYCDYEEGPEFYSEVSRKARKEHKCCECGHIIGPGEIYEYVAGKWSGDFSTYHTCEPCADLRDSLAQGGCWQFRGLIEHYWSYLDGWADQGQRHAAVFASHKAGPRK